MFENLLKNNVRFEAEVSRTQRCQLACPPSKWKFLSDGLTFPYILKELLATASQESKGDVGILFGAVALGKEKGQPGELGKDCQAARDQIEVRNQLASLVARSHSQIPG